MDAQHAEALGAFRDALVRSKALAHVDLTFNLIESEGAQLLLPALTPVRPASPWAVTLTRLQLTGDGHDHGRDGRRMQENAKLVSFQVDASLPSELFALLNRAPPADGKKKGKKKGGSAKKKK